MNIFIYSDESGVFDKVHNDLFVFGGLIILGEEKRDDWSRKYSAVEKVLRRNKGVSSSYELKATKITNKEKGKLFRSLNKCYKFAVVVKQQEVLDSIFRDKKTKQRYLDYAYKIAVKRALEELMKRKIIKASEIESMFFFVDEHTTATNGRYELREALEREFKSGTHNFNYQKFFPPIFPEMRELNLSFCNSEKKILIRAADIVANRVFYLARSGQFDKIKGIKNLFVSFLPSDYNPFDMKK